MIDKIGLTNFKAFNKLEPIKLAPLTIIMGKNSSGKSTILHSLLLLKQSMDSRDDESALTLDGKYLRYSNLSEIAHGLPSNKSAKIGFHLEINAKNSASKKSIPLIIGIKNSIDNGINKPSIDYVKTQYLDSLIDFRKMNLIQFKKIIKNHKDEFLDSYVTEGEVVNFSVRYDKFLPESIEIKKTVSNENKRSSSIRIPIDYLFQSDNVIAGLRRALVDIKYLSPVRATPQRAYIHYSDNASDLSEDGANSAHILWAKRDSMVKWKGKQYTLVDAVNQCIQCVGLQQNISPSRTGKLIYQIKVSIPNSAKTVTIADVGFGYSQIIPIVLTGLLNNPNNLMLIEQPEIHLHPSSCANLADLFLGFIEDGRKFLIETHSQDFINRLRLRVIENPSIKDKINIVFVDEAMSGEASARQFQIDEDGLFPQWPSGFIDESEKSARAIIKARSARKITNKENTENSAKAKLDN